MMSCSHDENCEGTFVRSDPGKFIALSGSRHNKTLRRRPLSLNVVIETQQMSSHNSLECSGPKLFWIVTPF